MRTTLRLAVGLAAGCGLGPTVFAQTPAGLDLQVYAGLTITGAVATVYSVEFVTDISQTNTPSAWRCLEYLQLPASPYLWTDKSALATRKRFYRAVAIEAPRNMVFIPPGTFRMGSPPDEQPPQVVAGPQTAVTISRGFWMGKYEVTQGEYETATGSNPSYYCGQRGDFYYGIDPNRPVESMSWSDATNYCNIVTVQAQRAGRIPVNCVYRLPTEAEWEYACRAWTSTRFSYGEDPGSTDSTTVPFLIVGYTNLGNHAWYAENSSFRTHAVGQKLPNPWGLFDMHGNVYELCQKCSGAYSGGIVVDPPPQASWLAVCRGGSWIDAAWGCFSSNHGYVILDSYPGDSNLGFRVVLAPSTYE
jgi:formylglycine-generating enzyme required for sulfatase activity